MSEMIIKAYYLVYHLTLQTWDSEPIKVIIGVEIWFLVCLLIAWGIASWRFKVKESRLQNK